MTAIAVGERVEPFEGVNQFGQSAVIGAGGPWLVFFYPFAFTGICSSELRGLQDAQQRLAHAGCKLAAISCDSMFALRVFADDERFTFSLVSDHWPHGAIAQRFGVFHSRRGCALRGSFVLDADHTVRWRAVQDLGQPRDIAAHVNAVEDLVSRKK